jgi:hypothetical protein
MLARDESDDLPCETHARFEVVAMRLADVAGEASDLALDHGLAARGSELSHDQAHDAHGEQHRHADGPRAPSKGAALNDRGGGGLSSQSGAVGALVSRSHLGTQPLCELAWRGSIASYMPAFPASFHAFFA